jgi:rhodanese-related sulfurtransferase
MVEITKFTCKELKQMRKETGARIIDIRYPSLFALSRLHNAVNIPSEWLKREFLHADRAIPLLVYSDTPAETNEALKVLKFMGFERVYNIGTLRDYGLCS